MIRKKAKRRVAKSQSFVYQKHKKTSQCALKSSLTGKNGFKDCKT
jgi:hypothetical protein